MKNNIQVFWLMLINKVRCNKCFILLRSLMASILVLALLLPAIKVPIYAVSDDPLAGTWVFNDKINYDSKNGVPYYINFTTDGKIADCLSLLPNNGNLVMSYNFVGEFNTLAYKDSLWAKESYKIINITSKLIDVDNGSDLLTWLKSNAIKKNITVAPPQVYAPSPLVMYNYNDYVDRVTVNGDMNTVTLAIPSDAVHIWIRREDQAEYESYQKYTHYRFEKGVKYEVIFDVWSSAEKAYLCLDKIPDNTEFFAYGRFGEAPLTYDAYCNVIYYDNVSTEAQLEQSDGPSFDLHATFDNNYRGAVIRFGLSGVTFGSTGDYTVALEDATMTMNISALIREQELAEQNNKLLEEIKSQLAEQQEDVMTGNDLNDHNVNGPGGFNDKVDQQNEQVQNGMDEINKIPKPDANSAIPDVEAQVPAEGMTLLSTIMGGITGYSIVPIFLMIVVGLFIVSFIMFGKKEN